MNNFKKFVSHFLVLGVLATAGGFSIVSGSQPLRGAKAEAVQAPARQKEYTAADFAGEEEADSELIGVSINQSNVTETSQSLTFTFRSKTVKAFATIRKNYIVQIDDANFSGDEKNPAADDYERIDEETGYPIFDGVVTFVTGSSQSAHADVYLPSTLTDNINGFIINVTKIMANAVTIDGAQYNGKMGQNSWDEINKIYIPKTITQVEAGAFTGFPDPADKDVQIIYQGSSIPAGFAAGWTDAPDSQIKCNATAFVGKGAFLDAVASQNVDDIEDDLGRPVNFVLGCEKTGDQGEEYNRPLIIQYDKVPAFTTKTDSPYKMTKFMVVPISLYSYFV